MTTLYDVNPELKTDIHNFIDEYNKVNLVKNDISLIVRKGKRFLCGCDINKIHELHNIVLMLDATLLEFNIIMILNGKEHWKLLNVKTGLVLHSEDEPNLFDLNPLYLEDRLSRFVDYCNGFNVPYQKTFKAIFDEQGSSGWVFIEESKIDYAHQKILNLNPTISHFDLVCSVSYADVREKVIEHISNLSTGIEQNLDSSNLEQKEHLSSNAIQSEKVANDLIDFIAAYNKRVHGDDVQAVDFVRQTFFIKCEHKIFESSITAPYTLIDALKNDPRIAETDLIIEEIINNVRRFKNNIPVEQFKRYVGRGEFRISIPILVENMPIVTLFFFYHND